MAEAINLQELRSRVEQVFPVAADAMAKYAFESIANGVKAAVQESILHRSKTTTVNFSAIIDLDSGEIRMSHSIASHSGNGSARCDAK